MFLLPSILISSICLWQFVGAANILAAFPVPVKSHWTVMRPFLIELAKRGHNLTVITPFEEKNVPDTWETVIVQNFWPFGGHLREGVFKQKASPMSSILRQFMIFKGGIDMCEKQLEDENVQKIINMEEKKFDCLIIELFFNDCFLAFSHKFRIPIIGMTSSAGFIWAPDSVGNPSPLSYVPVVPSDFTDHMTFPDRLKNTMLGMYQRITRQLYFVPKIDAIVQKYFKDPHIPSISVIERNTSLILMNTHTSYGYPQPNVPCIVEVGGMHQHPHEKLPKGLQNFLDKCVNGVIYFSLGSNIQSSNMPEEKTAVFLNVFSKLKQCVLWKWESDNLPGKPDNLKIEKWLPQTDLLAHKNLQLFITHGGLLSTIEAISHGVPVVGIPIMADQHSNVRKMEAAGIGIKLDFQNITEDSLKWAISEVLNNQRYKKNVLHRNRIFHDRPMKPLEEAVYWTEYVLKHKGAYHLQSAALSLTWYQYALLDVVCFILAVASGIVAIMILLVRALIKSISNHKHTNKSTKSRRKKID